ncbi:MAG: dihydrodipicolinate reductase [Acidobacteriota bacterium]|nr:dihydrodipicolinate reductase [Acidobacteriota bacterium]
MNKSARARVALVGLGPIGIEVGRALVGRASLELLGAADPAADKAGRPLGDLLGTSASGGPVVDSSAATLYARSAKDRGRADVVILCTGSRLASVTAQIEEAVNAGMHVVSTCEELSFPELKSSALGRRIDERARANGVAVLGTGVNPGLVMDRLALAAAGACVRVDHVKVTRVVDAAKRRGPLRAKVGAGLSREEFLAGVAARKLGHVGLSESAAIIALGLGLPIDEITETIEPVIATRETDGIAAGRVLGLHQIAFVQAGDERKVELDLTMAVGVEDPADTIEIGGDPPVHLRVSGGFHGDRATVGCVINAIPFVVNGPPGLQTVVTLPLFGLAPQEA